MRSDSTKREADELLRDARRLLREHREQWPEDDVHSRVYWCRACDSVDIAVGVIEVLTDDVACGECGGIARAASVAADRILPAGSVRAPRRAFKGL